VLARDVRAELRVEAVEDAQPFLVELVEPTRQHRVNQRFLAAEMIVDGGEIHRCARRDLPHRHRLETMLDEQILGRIEDARLRAAALPAVACLTHCHVPPPMPVARLRTTLAIM